MGARRRFQVLWSCKLVARATIGAGARKFATEIFLSQR